MRIFGAVFFLSLAIGPASAQFGNVVFPAFAHAPFGGNPWGNVALPASPGNVANAAFGSHPGAPAGGYRGYGSTRGYRRGYGSAVYAYPVFVGGGYGYGYGYDQPPQQAPDSSGAYPPAQPPVVINQYFGTAPPAEGQPPDSASVHFYQAPGNPVEDTPGETSYYLIAMQDHTIYSAVAYYVEGDTLHYFTAGNVHNQVSLALVDRDLTLRLNRDRNVEVVLPRK